MFEFNLLQLANYLFSHRWWLSIATAICVLLATVWVTFIKAPAYRATVTINIDLFAEEKGGAMAFSSPFFMQDQMIANKVGIVEQYFDSEEFRTFLFRIMASEDVSESLKDDLAVIKDELVKQKIDTKDEMSDWVHSQLALKGYNDKSRIDLSSSAPRPVLAAALANFGAHALIEYNRLMLVQRLKNLKTFLNTQTTKTKKELRVLEDQMVALQRSAKIISPDEVRIKVNALQVDQEAKLIEFDRHYAALNALIAETEADLGYFKQLMQENKPASYIYIEQIQRRLEILRYEKANAQRSGKVDTSLDKGIDAVIAELAKQLETLGPISQSPWEYVKKIEAGLFELKQKRQQAKGELAAHQVALQRTSKQFSGLPNVLMQMSEIKRSIDLTMSLYTALMTRLQDTAIKEAAHSNDLIVVSSAELPGAPSGLGKTKTVLLSIIGGFILAALPLFLRFVLLPTIRNVKDLRHLNVPIVGALAWYRSNGRNILPIRFQDRTPRLLVEAPNTPETNALRFVRFQVEQALQIRAFQAGKASKLLQISSVNPKEGRTFIAANLADLFATSGVRVCLIDLDFGNPGVNDFFPGAKVEDSPMVEMFPAECAFQSMRVNDKLTIIRPKAPVAGNMSETLETREFESALNALEVIYELIILDTPPLTGHMEPVITAQYSDALMLVINQRRTLRNEVEDAIRTLQGSLKLPIFGVMNFVFDEISVARRRQKSISRRPDPRPPGERAA